MMMNYVPSVIAKRLPSSQDEVQTETAAASKEMRKFRKGRKKALDLEERTLKKYKEINEKLEKSGIERLDEPCFNEDETNIRQKLKGEPRILFMGKLSSGKSSLINAMLGQSVLPHHAEPCTARLIELKYGPRNKLEIIHDLEENAYIEAEKLLDNCKIPRGLIMLNDVERKDERHVNKKVLAELTIDFLKKSGLTLVDTPGLSENDRLVKLAPQYIKGILPLIVYVIKGTDAFDLIDSNQIKTLIQDSHVPHDNIIYVVTHCDNDSQASTGSDDEEEESCDEVETRRKTRVFKELQNNGLVRHEMEKCSHFYAMSLTRLAKYRKDQEKNSEYKKYKERIDCLQKKLVDFMGESALNYVKKSLTIIHVGLVRMDSDLNRKNKRINEQILRQKHKLDQLNRLKNEENSLQQTLSEYIDHQTQTEMESLVSRIITEKRGHLEADAYRYLRQNPDTSKVNLRNALMAELFGLFHQEQEMEAKFEEMFHQLNHLVANFNENVDSGNSLREAIESLKIPKYELNLSDWAQYQSWWGWFMTLISNFFTAPFRWFTDIDWRQEVINEFIQTLNVAKATELLSSSFKEYIGSQHDKIVEAIGKLEKDYKGKKSDLNNQANKVKTCKESLNDVRENCERMMEVAEDPDEEFEPTEIGTDAAQNEPTEIGTEATEDQSWLYCN